ncbi:MAG: hypothetical protein LBB34_02350 [Holosporales bacterium]|jgi:hypothetical protein|nr:hypothetical protein [Holosporales bacterium]
MTIPLTKEFAKCNPHPKKRILLALRQATEEARRESLGVDRKLTVVLLQEVFFTALYDLGNQSTPAAEYITYFQKILVNFF